MQIDEKYDSSNGKKADKMMLSVSRNTNTSRNRNPSKFTITSDWTEQVFKIDKIFFSKTKPPSIGKTSLYIFDVYIFSQGIVSCPVVLRLQRRRIYAYVYWSLYGCIIAITNCVARTVKMRYSTNTKLE